MRPNSASGACGFLLRRGGASSGWTAAMPCIGLPVSSMPLASAKLRIIFSTFELVAGGSGLVALARGGGPPGTPVGGPQLVDPDVDLAVELIAVPAGQQPAGVPALDGRPGGAGQRGGLGE